MLASLFGCALVRLFPSCLLFPTILLRGDTQAMISLLFSFMVIWDLPNLRRGIRALKTSRLSFAYNTVSPQVCYLVLDLLRCLRRAVVEESSVEACPGSCPLSHEVFLHREGFCVVLLVCRLTTADSNEGF